MLGPRWIFASGAERWRPVGSAGGEAGGGATCAEAFSAKSMSITNVKRPAAPRSSMTKNFVAQARARRVNYVGSLIHFFL